MTTIACNLKEMAADSQVSGDSSVPFATKKLWRHGDSLIGLCGMLGPAMKFIQWRHAGGEHPKFRDDDYFMALELTPMGILYWDQHLVPAPVLEEEYAVGSGGDVALYCMRIRGMGPARAVAEACKIDPYSAEPVVTERLKVNRKT